MKPPPVVGVLGGTFDPVHLGHLRMARAVLDALRLDSVRLMPAWHAPHKTARTVTDAGHRLAMLRMAVRGRRGLRLEKLELEAGEVRYTVDSLRRLRNRSPACRPVFVLGMDSLAEIRTWRDHETLLEEFDLAVLERPDQIDAGSPPLPPEVARRLTVVTDRDPAPGHAVVGRGGRVYRVPMEPVAISSTMVRARAASGGELRDLVPPAVARYIRANRLYSGEERH